jgi:hypothetical protein
MGVPLRQLHNKQQAQTGRTHDTLGSVLAAETVVQYSLSHIHGRATEGKACLQIDLGVELMVKAV